MSKNVIGSNIKKLRTSNKLTEKEFSKKIKISEQKLKDIESGEINPDIICLFNISQNFDISILELLKEKDKIDINDNKKNKLLNNTIKEVDDKMSILRNAVISLSIITFLILSIFIYYLFSSYNEANEDITYNFYGESKNFKFEDGKVVFSNKKNNLLEIKTFKFIDSEEFKVDDISSFEMSIYFGRELWASDEYNKTKHGSFNKWLEENIGFSERLSYPCIKEGKNCSDGIFSKFTQSSFSKDISVKIKYCTDKNKCNSEDLKIVTYQIIT